jgi:crotonobetainyl-CoA:carnitine CoA-transferase CaiB-like acyl-CoA transferase
MYAYSGILAALIGRWASGEGAALDVSLFDALAEWMGYAAYYTAYGGRAPARSGAHHASIAPYGPFAAGDGGQIFLAVQNAREWTRFCADVLGQPTLADDERFRTNAQRASNRPALHDEVDRVFANLTTQDVLDRLERADIACARMNSVRQFLDHPQLEARDRWRTIGSPAGPLRALVPPVVARGDEPRMDDVPALGQHTDAILAELGVEPATIARWRQESVI